MDRLDISIHAPARGATITEKMLKKFQFYFNPRSRKGSDDWIERQEAEDEAFQSTLPQGERPKVGGWEQRFDIISIHAPARGATYF